VGFSAAIILEVKRNFMNRKSTLFNFLMILSFVVSGVTMAQAQVVINEVYQRLAAVPNGDANGDNVRNATNDEFIELVNSGATAVDISGWSITTGAAAPGTLQHIFGAGTILPPGGAIVVFGGPVEAPLTEFPNIFGGAIVQAADDNGDTAGGNIGLTFTDAGTTIRIYAVSAPTGGDTPVTSLVYTSVSGDAGVSITRIPDVTGTLSTVPNHPVLSGRSYSPGVKQDGAPFITNVKFASASASVSEGAGTFDLTISVLNPDAVTSTDFDIVLVSGTAGDINSYTTQSRSVTGATDTNITVTITLTDDAETEANENLVFEIQNVTGGKSAKRVSREQFTLTLEDNDFTKLKFDPTTASVSENSGTYQLQVLIENPDPANATTADVVLTAGDATDVNNYTTAQVTFPAGSVTAQTVTLTITNNAVIGDVGNLTFQLQNVAGGNNAAADASNGEFSLTITDDDNPIHINELYVRLAGTPNGDANGDGERNIVNDEFIELVNFTSAAVDISGWSLATGGTAPGTVQHIFPTGTIIPAGGAIVVFGGPVETAPVEYRNIFGGAIVQAADDNGDVAGGNIGLSFADAGTTVRLYNISAPTAGDTPLESISYTSVAGDAGVSVTRIPDVTGPMGLTPNHPALNGISYSPGVKADGTPYITNVRFSASSASVDEGDDTYELVVSVLNPDATTATDFDVVLISGDAADIAAYSTQSRSITGTGATEVTITVTLTDDASIEPNEDLVFAIQNVAGGKSAAVVEPAQFTLTINDNDFTKVEFAATSVTINEGDGTYQIEVSIANPDAVNATTADIVLSNGTATDINDYQTVTLTFPAGSAASQFVTVNITNDTEMELTDEVFTFAIQNVQGGNNASLGTNSTFDLTIQDNDIPTGPLFIINEIHPRLELSPGGDANGDGTRSTTNDEFIEFLNVASFDLDVSGWKVTTGTTLQHIFPAGTIVPAGGALLLFGGPDPDETAFGGSVVQTADDGTGAIGLSLTDQSTTVKLLNASDELMEEVTYWSESSTFAGVSIARDPDGGDFTYDGLMRALPNHPSVILSDGLSHRYSPGVRVDGTRFIEITTTQVQFDQKNGGLYENDLSSFEASIGITLPDNTNTTTFDIVLVTPDPDNEIEFTPATITFNAGETGSKTFSITVNDDAVLEGDEVFTFEIVNVTGGNQASAGSDKRFSFRIYDNDLPVIFNEVHAAPATDITGDANHDGTRNATEDEFVELVNVTDSDIDMSGWKIYTGSIGGTLRHTFLPGTFLPAGRAILVFGGGVPLGFFGGSEFQLASEGGLGLTDVGATVILTNSANELQSSFTYGSEANAKQSVTRAPDITGYYDIHSEASATGALFSPGLRADGFPFGDITTDVPDAIRFAVAAYPNPTQHLITLEVTGDSARQGHAWMITSATGTVIFQMESGDKNLIHLDVAAWPSGIYFYKVKSTVSGKTIGTGRFSVIR
jgi:hypothetical protein